MLRLPSDVLLLLCEELGSRQDFGTLFNCALTGKDMVSSALLWLYRIHSQSSVITGEGNDADFASGRGLTFQARSQEQRNTVLKWALQWKSIIRSSLGNTAFPYCLYIRSLDLRNLADLLAEDLFREVALENFFADDMAKFLKSQETPIKNKTRGQKRVYHRINVPLVLDLVGESITSFVSESASQNQATVALEDLAGEISSSALQVWSSRLSRLKGLTLWDGAALDEKVAAAISESCYDFDDLTFFTCLPTGTKTYAEIDRDMASFFNGLRPNSLRSFSALSAKAVGPETLRALNHHAKSLKVLKLTGLDSATIRKLSHLQNCTALETLELADGDGTVNLEETENDIFLEVISWLESCKGLRDLHISNLISAPAILTKLCLNNDIRLRELDLDQYTLVRNIDFHRAIAHQTSLESLKLSGDAEGAFRDDNDTLISSICQLKKLRYLNLLNISDYFGTPEVLRLAADLQNLEELWFGGYEVTDDIWHALSTLPNLRSLNIHAMSSFTFDGILAFISTLQPTNQGLLLSIMNQSPENIIPEDLQTVIRDSIAMRVDGQFDFVLFRDPESDSEDLSD